MRLGENGLCEFSVEIFYKCTRANKRGDVAKRGNKTIDGLGSVRLLHHSLIIHYK